jgi:serine/threonine protein kinase
VYGGLDVDGKPVAVKVLAQDRVNSDKRRRFKNEVSFLAKNKHANIVTVLDHGLATRGKSPVPFYVMRRYDESLRDSMRGGVLPSDVLKLFSQILDGVEAAHLQGVIHRDLKPENVLVDTKLCSLAVADFGTARFTEDLVSTVQTAPGQRLANFQYAAPEQRTPGKAVGVTADIYALGLILNEMFTGNVPHGTDFKLIRAPAPEFTFLDEIVAKMLRQVPEDRPASVEDVKS